MDAREWSVKATPATQVRLLDLQQVDSQLARCAHRLRTLPEAQTVAELERKTLALRNEQASTQAAMSDLKLQVNRTEADITAVRARTERDKSLLDSGNTAASKHLTELEHELATLARRQAELEDSELELLQSIEDLERVDAQLAAELATTESDLQAAQVARSETTTAITVEQQELRQQRDTLTAEIPDDLVTLYERIRSDGAQVAAGLLRGQRCEACQMELAMADAAELRAAATDEVLRCPECRSIVVRAELLSA
jgi:uncharacterized protein